MSESDSRNQHKECNLPLSPLRSPLLSHFDLPTDFLNNDAHLFNENDLFGSNTFGVFSHSSSPSIPQITQDPGINSFFKDEHKLGGISQMHASQSSLKSEPANVSSEEPLFYDSGLPIDGLGTPFSPAGLGYQHQLSNHTPTPPPLEATETLESQEEQRHRNSPSPVTTRRRVNSGSHQSIDRLTEEFDGLVPAYDDQESEEEREDTNDKNNKYLPPHVSSLLQSSKVVHSSSTPSSSSSSNRHSVLHSTAASQVQSEELSTISQRKKNGTLCLGNFLFNCTAERPTENRVRPFGRCDACLRGKSVPLSRARVSRFTFSSANRKTLIAATSAHGAIKCEKFPNVYKDWCLFVFQTEEDARRSTVALGDVGEEPALQEVHGVLPRHIWTTGVPFFRSGKHNKLIPQPIKSADDPSNSSRKTLREKAQLGMFDNASGRSFMSSNSSDITRPFRSNREFLPPQNPFLQYPPATGTCVAPILNANVIIHQPSFQTSALYSTAPQILQHSQQAHSQQLHSQQAHSQQAHSQQAHSQQAHSQQAHPQHAHSQHAHSQHAHSQHAHSQHAHSQQAHSQQAHSQQAHSQQAHSQQAHSQQAHSQQAHSQQAHSQQAHSQQAHSQQAHSQSSQQPLAAMIDDFSNELGAMKLHTSQFLQPKPKKSPNSKLLKQPLESRYKSLLQKSPPSFTNDRPRKRQKLPLMYAVCDCGEPRCNHDFDPNSWVIPPDIPERGPIRTMNYSDLSSVTNEGPHHVTFMTKPPLETDAFLLDTLSYKRFEFRIPTPLKHMIKPNQQLKVKVIFVDEELSESTEIGSFTFKFPDTDPSAMFMRQKLRRPSYDLAMEVGDLTLQEEHDRQAKELANKIRAGDEFSEDDAKSQKKMKHNISGKTSEATRTPLQPSKYENCIPLTSMDAGRLAPSASAAVIACHQTTLTDTVSTLAPSSMSRSSFSFNSCNSPPPPPATATCISPPPPPPSDVSPIKTA